MATRIQTASVQNLQQLEAVMTGPDGANRLFTVCGQFITNVQAFSSGPNVQQIETFTVLVGQYLPGNNSSGRSARLQSQGKLHVCKSFRESFSWNIVSSDADWDDESGQVELRIEVHVSCNGNNNAATINALAFQVTILGAVVE